MAKATVLHHQYPSGTPPFVWAELSTCFRVGNLGSVDLLNNRDSHPFVVRTLVYVQGDELCSPGAGFPKVLWLSGGLGDTFEIPLPVEAGSPPLEPVYCRFATDDEAGGGPSTSERRSGKARAPSSR